MVTQLATYLFLLLASLYPKQKLQSGVSATLH